MLNVSSITKAVYEILKADDHLSAYRIVRGEFVNDNPSLCPWVGVYRSRAHYEPRTLGLSATHKRGSVIMRLIVQAANMHSGSECEDWVEEYVATVLGVLFDNITLKQTIENWNSVSVDYVYDEASSESLYFQSAVITIDAEVKTQ